MLRLLFVDGSFYCTSHSAYTARMPRLSHPTWLSEAKTTCPTPQLRYCQPKGVSPTPEVIKPQIYINPHLLISTNLHPKSSPPPTTHLRPQIFFITHIQERTLIITDPNPITDECEPQITRKGATFNLLSNVV